MNAGEATLINNKKYPFNDSRITVALRNVEKSPDYDVRTEIINCQGDAGNIIVSDRAVNGFKMEFTGSAPKVTVRYRVIGGFWDECD
jgi:hypothetical protein